MCDVVAHARGRASDDSPTPPSQLTDVSYGRSYGLWLCFYTYRKPRTTPFYIHVQNLCQLPSARTRGRATVLIKVFD